MRSTDPSESPQPNPSENWRREPRNGLGIYQILNVVWGRRVLVAVVVGVLTLVVATYGLLRDPDYVAEAVVTIRPLEESSGAESAESFMGEVIGVVATDEMLEEVAREAGYRNDVAVLRKRLDVQTSSPQDGGSGSLKVTFPGEDATEAARTANAYATVFVERVEELNDQRVAGGSLGAEAVVLRRAEPPQSYSWIRIALYGLGAVAAGVLAGGTAALALDGGVRSWRGPRDAELTLRVPVIGVIPEYESITQRRT